MTRPAPKIVPDLDLARSMFGELERNTRIGRGITRDTYGPGENFAHQLAERVARGLGLEVARDAALNLYMTLQGRRRDLPRFVTGSHMDSVPEGGNYDGAAGVVAGLSAVAGLRTHGIVPQRDITVMAIRGEEAAWFNSSYIGSHAAFGKLAADAFEVPRSDTRRTLADHMAEAGCDVAALRRGEAYLNPATIAAFLEVHIEQGPVLEQASLPVGIVTGIRGCLRHRDARCLGAYAHSGAAPRRLRQDAVAATAELVYRLGEACIAMENAGADLVFTVGQFNTDPAISAPSKVAGETRFVLDFRGLEEGVMRNASHAAARLAEEIGARHKVRFDLGEALYSYPAVMNHPLRQRLSALASDLEIPALELASGAGHDSAVFATFGVPTGMIFVRNANGSHNPDEAMELSDFGLAAGLLATHFARD
ncbi:MAG TPA: hydantoinase/carbamoylase family amidase, partial [Dongiaceae bacterium]|nr:hydantoinase/carbamoylase family amidase [Dongiaceae bacterium]